MQKMNAELGIGKFTERHVEHYLQRFDTDQDKLLSQEEWPGSIRPGGNGADGRVWRNGGAGPVVLANLCKVSHFFLKGMFPGETDTNAPGRFQELYRVLLMVKLEEAAAFSKWEFLLMGI